MQDVSDGDVILAPPRSALSTDADVLANALDAEQTALLAAVGAETPRPEWAGPEVAGERWIALGPDVGLVAGRYAAVTCLVRGLTNARPRRRKRRRKRRHHR